MHRGIGTFGVLLAGLLLALPASASAAWSSTITGGTATVSSAGASGTLVIRADPTGFLRHNQSVGDGFQTPFDFNSTNGAVEDKLPNNSGSAVNVIGGIGNDRLQLGTGASAASLIATPIAFDGGSGAVDELTLVDGNSPSTPNAQLMAGLISGIGPTTFTYQNLDAMTLEGGFGPGTYSLFPGLPADTRVFGFGGADTFVMKPGVSAGTLDGQAGEDTVDFSDRTSPVNVAVPDTAFAQADMDGAQEVPSGSGHPTASGFATVQLDLTNPCCSLDIQMDVDGITPATDTISGTHIHVGASGTEGAIIADLGTAGWTDNGSGGMSFTGIDVPFPAAEVEDFEAGNTYVNVHTTNPNFPDGAIRGQLGQITYQQAATGATLRDIQRYKGGAGADIINGSPEANVLDGNGGADGLFGLAGNDTLNAQDGFADTVLDCGPGAGDVANRDRASIDPSPINCETVNTIPEPDADGDGVPDPSDACPNEAAATADGCPVVTPPDSDGDGITDAFDACPNQAGPASNGGCPVTAKPSNEIKLGKPKQNTKNGTAVLPVEVPGAGELELTGKGVKPIDKQAGGAGTVNLKVKPTGKTADTLDMQGKAKVTVEVTFTPTGGDPNSESKRVGLKKK